MKKKEPIINDKGEIRSLTKADVAAFRPIEDVLPEKFVKAVRAHMRGRPKKEVTKQQVTLRLDADILDYFRSGGPGWQTRVNDTLRGLLE